MKPSSLAWSPLEMGTLNLKVKSDSQLVDGKYQEKDLQLIKYLKSYVIY